MHSTTQAALDTTGALPLAEASHPGRLISLDVFRGLTVMAISKSQCLSRIFKAAPHMTAFASSIIRRGPVGAPG